MTSREELIAENKREGASTKRMVNAFSDEDTNWTPHEKSTPAFGLAKHVVGLHVWLKEVLQKEGLNLATDVKPISANTFKDLIEILDKAVEANDKFLASTDDAFWNKEFSVKFGDHEIMTAQRSTVARHFLNNHLIHHRGQLSVYVRLLNRSVPGMYGPSADEK